MTRASAELMPFVHTENGESYLFAFEDYLDDAELEKLWDEAVFLWKGYSNADLGEPADDVIDIIVRNMGLRRPEPGSPLEEAIISRTYDIAWREEETMERNMEAGFDTDLDAAPLPMSVLKIGRM